MKKKFIYIIIILSFIFIPIKGKAGVTYCKYSNGEYYSTIYFLGKRDSKDYWQVETTNYSNYLKYSAIGSLHDVLNNNNEHTLKTAISSSTDYDNFVCPNDAYLCDVNNKKKEMLYFKTTDVSSCIRLGLNYDINSVINQYDIDLRIDSETVLDGTFSEKVKTSIKYFVDNIIPQNSFSVEYDRKFSTSLINKLSRVKSNNINIIVNKVNLLKTEAIKASKTYNPSSDEYKNVQKLINYLNTVDFTKIYADIWDDIISSYIEYEGDNGNNGNITCTSLLGRTDEKQSPAWYLSIAFNVVKYVAIILLIVFSIMDYVSAITSNDSDSLKKANSKFIKRLVICIIIFLLPFLLNFVLNYISDRQTGLCGIGGS